MKIMRKIGIVFAILSICSINTFGDDNSSRRHGDRRPGPPPEAYDICEGKTAGDKAELTTPHGNTITGTCIEEGEDLVFRPDQLKGMAGRMPHTPPEEAIEACEGKNEGDTAEFVNERGDTVTGTCEQHGDQLVLRPDRMPKRDED